MPAGRPRKPSRLKLLEGNRGKRNISEDDDLPAKPGKPQCPEHLKGEAKKEWRRAVKWLGDMGVLARADRAALANYCTAWARLIEALENLETSPMVFKTTTNYPVVNPWWNIAVKADEQVHRYLREFGFSPSARATIVGTAAVNQNKSDPVQDFINRKKQLRLIAERDE